MYLWLCIVGVCILPSMATLDSQGSVYGEYTGLGQTQSADETAGYWNILSSLLLELANTIGLDPQPVSSEPSDNGLGTMEDAARMLQHDYYGGGQTGYQSMSDLYHNQGYQQQQVEGGYGMTGYGFQQQQGYHQTHKEPRKRGYKKKPKKVYVPVVIRKKRKKKMKTISVYKGFYIPGGSQVFGKFKTVEDCKKSCAVSPTCFSADYNPWLKKCYHHNNITACSDMRTHPKLIHFKKVPCQILETPRGLLTLGTHIFGGLEQKGIKSLQECVKKCATAGQGIALNTAAIATQTCFAIDYDFATHKCYFHTDDALCPALIITPPQLSARPSSINLLICPFQT